jgi:hypothetical protein
MNGSSSLAGWPEINDDGSNSLLDDGSIFSSPWTAAVPRKHFILHFDPFLQFSLILSHPLTRFSKFLSFLCLLCSTVDTPNLGTCAIVNPVELPIASTPRQ